MFQPEDNIDLTKVDYDDVLHLYRGWKKSEISLKEKNKELQSLKSRINMLQESHLQFKSQIKALEGVKELTVDLQHGQAKLQQENRHLQEENKELAGLNMQAEYLLQEKATTEDQQNKKLNDITIEFATLAGRYEETLKAQRGLENLCTVEQTTRLAAESRCVSFEEHVEQLGEENRILKQKHDATLIKLNQCDYELQHASEQLSSLSKEVQCLNQSKNQASTSEAEIGILKGDISRLLRLLEFSPANKDFFEQWQDSNGMAFIGIDRDPGGMTGTEGTGLDPIDTWNDRPANLSFNNTDLTPAEFAHLKRIHGGDPFPMTSNTAEEQEYWVPNDAARLGLQFLASKMPHASPKVIMDFLRSMNKIWLRRERRKLKRAKAVSSNAIAELKRRMNNSKPYKGVLAERQIRRLKSQVKEERAKSMTGRPKRGDEFGQFDSDDQEIEDVQDMPFSETRHCKVVKRQKEHAKADVQRVASNKLLQASLTSLESVSRRMSIAKEANANSMYNDDGFDGDGFEAEGPMPSTYKANQHPSASYLRGALWLGRNLSMLCEDMADDMETYRSKYVLEVASASQDTNPRRCMHRLNLLAGSCITETSSRINKTKGRAREMLQGLSAIAPGDAQKMQRYLATLPIESTLVPSSSMRKSRSSAVDEEHEGDNVYVMGDGTSRMNQSDLRASYY